MRAPDPASAGPIPGGEALPPLAVEVPPEARRVVADARRFETTFERGAKKLVWHRWGSGPSLVLLHGGGGSWTHWIRNIPALAQRFTVWIPDLPGYGDSDLPAEPHSYPRLGQAVAEGYAQLVPAGPLRAAGFSFGCSIAPDFVIGLGTRVEQLVLVGANVIARLSGGLPYRNWKKASSEDERDDAIRANLVAVMIHDPARIDALAMRLQKDNLARQRLSPIAVVDRVNLIDALPRLPPALRLAGISGSEDFLVDGRMAEQVVAFPKLRPGAEFHLIERGGHWVMYDSAQEFNRVFLDVLER
jgi:pimeloyl-ACP methyl ester carboxylesterase